jgi:hypothetical protein
MTEQLRFSPSPAGRGGWDLPGLGSFQVSRRLFTGSTIDAAGRHLTVERHGWFKGRLSFLDDSGAEAGSYTPDGALKRSGELRLDGRSWRCATGRRRSYQVSGDDGSARYTVGRKELTVDVDGSLARDGLPLVVGGYLAVADAESRRRQQAGAAAAAAASATSS